MELWFRRTICRRSAKRSCDYTTIQISLSKWGLPEEKEQWRSSPGIISATGSRKHIGLPWRFAGRNSSHEFHFGDPTQAVGGCHFDHARTQGIAQALSQGAHHPRARLSL